MSTLLDTNILLRSAQPSHAMYAAADGAVAELRRQGEALHIVPQNLYEFWAVCTRPVAQNGLGFPFARAQAELARLKSLFTLRDDVPAVYASWEVLIAQYQVSGKKAHDARLVAAMKTHGIGRILTFNVADFQRYQGVTVLDPRQITAPPTP